LMRVLGGETLRLTGTEGSQLRTFIRSDLLATLIFSVALVPVRILLVPSQWVDLLIMLCLAMAACLVWATVMVTRYRYVAAVMIVTVANWMIAVTATAIVPFTLAILTAVALLPPLVAVQHLNRLQLSAMLGATITGRLPIS
jgi:hypothetical protein